MFVLQKVVARVFFPLPIVFWLVLAAGIAARRGARRLSRILAVAAVVWLFLVSWNPVGDALLRTLEYRYAPLHTVPGEISHIVVLGGGAHRDAERPVTTRLSRSSQGRVLEGVRLWRAAAASRASGIPLLVFTGDSIDGRRSMASLGAETAVDLGVPEQFVVAIEKTYNTAQEGAAIASLFDDYAGGTTFVLVTGAAHMPRSMVVFRDLGLDPIPAPAQYLTDSAGGSVWTLFPSAGALAKTERFFYEVLGLLRQQMN